jgi:hypothetical protein
VNPNPSLPPFRKGRNTPLFSKEGTGEIIRKKINADFQD